jgi:hypothetical protein
MTPPTLDEYRAWAATASRNWTDDPLGSDPTRRRADIRASNAITPADNTTTSKPRKARLAPTSPPEPRNGSTGSQTAQKPENAT